MFISILLLVALAMLCVVSVIILRQKLVDQAVSTLYLANESTAGRVFESLELTGGLPPVEDFFAMPPDAFSLTLAEGTPIRSGYLTRDYAYRELRPAEIVEIKTQLASQENPVTVTIDGLGTYLVTTYIVQPTEDESFHVITGIGLAEADAVVRTYVMWISVIGVGIAMLAAAFGFRLVTKELDPLEKVARVAQDVAAAPLSSGAVARQARVPRPSRLEGSETDRVADALNHLLSQVEIALNQRHRAEESMRRFIAEASHELRNPLASIRGYADFYTQPDASADEMPAALGRIGAEAARMSKLVDDLLLLAKLDADPDDPMEDVELSQLVVETTSDARFAYPDHIWRIALPGDAVVVSGNPDSIRQMLLNLVANAGHHTPAGTTVRIEVALGDGSVDIIVQDDGPGIPAAALPTLFDRFTQAGPGNGTRKSTTVGLGLAIVKALASAANYIVHVASDDHGTRFTIRIPVLPASAVETSS